MKPKPPPPPELSAAQLQADELDLNAALAGLATIVAGACSVDEMLSQVAQFAVQSIPGADGAGVVHIHAFLEAIPGEGAIHGAGVDIGEAEAAGDEFGVGAFAAGTGAVDGDDDGVVQG